jgi:hypothetical protein
VSDTPDVPALPVPAKRRNPKSRKRARKSVAIPVAEKPSLGLPDSLEAAQETARHAQEGSLKLSRAVDALRTALETIVMAEVDRTTGMAVTTRDLRGIAVDGLNAYSQICGQSWKKHKLVGNWAGGTGNSPVHERDM